MDRSTQDESHVKTYFGLRMGLFVLAVMLFVSVAAQWLFVGCLQGSISAYYYTPVRPVLIATLCAIGACLVIYHGNLVWENALLDVAGFLAFIVAFVPTGFDGSDVGGCTAIDVPDTSIAIQNNVLSVVVIGVLATIVGRMSLSRVYPGSSPGSAKASRVALAVCVVLLLVFAFFFFDDYGFFIEVAHMVAAALFFGLTLAVMLMNFLDAKGAVRWWYLGFFAGAVVVGAGVLAGHALVPGFRTWIFWLEAVGIVGFAGFWLVQTIELQGRAGRS